MATEAEIGMMQPPAKNAWSYKSLKKQRSRVLYSLLESRDGRFHCYGLHTYEIINLSCFEPPSSWLFVTAALEN